MHPRGAEVRTISYSTTSERVAVGVIVICDACGNREIGWAYLYPGATVAEFVPQIEGSPVNPHDEGGPMASRSPASLWKIKDRLGRLSSVSWMKDMPTDPEPMVAKCPRHGWCETTEMLAASDVSRTRTKKVRAYARSMR